MAMLKGYTIYFAHLGKPHKPPFGGKDAVEPRWDVQLRITDPDQKKELESFGIKPKLMKEPDEIRDPENPKGPRIENPNAGQLILDEHGNKQWKYSLTRFLYKKDRSENEPPKVQNGQLDDIDPETVGDGSVANISIFQYDTVKDGIPGKGTIMRNLQITKLVKRKPYEGGSGDEFEPTETEVVEVADEDDDDAPPPTPAKKPAPPAPSKGAPKPPTKPANKKDIY